MDADGKGAAYAESDKVGLMVKARPDREDISFTFMSTIAGIIAHWVGDNSLIRQRSHI
jgi:hypothetical protein